MPIRRKVHTEPEQTHCGGRMTLFKALDPLQTAANETA